MRWLWIPLLPLLLPLLALQLIVFWQIIVLPTATVHYSKDAVQELRYTWNVQDRLYRGRMSPGGAVSDDGFLSPDAKFFMEFSWAANIDSSEGSGTDMDRLKPCPGESFDP